MHMTGIKRSIIRSQVGTSLTEVLVTLGIVSTLMGIGVLSLDKGYLDIDTTGQTLVNDLRIARMQATLKGARFRVSMQASSYKVERLHDPDGDGVWTVNSAYPAKNVNLPTEFLMLSVGAAGYGTNAIFDGRGMLVKEDGSAGLTMLTILVVDPDGDQRLVRVWPSGQVEIIESA